MTFPTTPLDVRVDLLLSGAWTDITDDVRVDQKIVINRGRADEASRPDPQTCALTLDNRAGKYSPRCPTSPYYGVLGRNTPLRVGVGTPCLGAASGTLVDSTSLVAPTVTAEVAGRQITVWGATPAGNITVPGGFTAGTERDGTLSTWQRGTKTISAGATGTATATHSVTATAQCAANVVIPGTTTISSSTSGVAAGATVSATVTAVAGDWLVCFHGFSSDPADDMVRPPLLKSAPTPAWILLCDSGASDGPRVQAWALRVDTAGTFDVVFDSLTGIDNYARVEVVNGATDYFVRFIGEVATWPITWDLSGHDVIASVTATGVRRRLGSGASPQLSAMRREFGRTAGLKAYWPLEDGASSTSFGSAVGGRPMTFYGNPVCAADSTFACAAPLPTFAHAAAKGPVPWYATTNAFSVGSLVHIPSGLTDEAILLTVVTTGSAGTWAVKWEAGAVGFRVQAWDEGGVEIENLTIGPWTVSPLDGAGFLRLAAAASGANIAWNLAWMGIHPDSNTINSEIAGDTIASQTVGRVLSVRLGGGLVSLDTDVVFGHVAVAASSTALFTSAVYDAVAAWTGYTGVARLYRLCRDGNVLISQRAAGAAAGIESDLMGPQRVATLLTLLDNATDTDGGVLSEPKGFLGFQLRSRSSLLSQAPALTLTYTTPGHIGYPLAPVDDDQGTVNDVTVTRTDGGSSRVELLTGPLSVLPPPNGVGRYDSTYDLSLFADDQTPDRASWLLHLGTWDEARWSSVRTQLEAAPALIPSVAALDVGDVITLTGLPSFVPPGPVDLMLQGYQETLEPYGWEFIGNYSPAGPWRTLLLDDAELGRVDSETASLASSMTTTATSASVATSAGDAIWITTAANAGDFPFDVMIAGERMTVMAITGTTSPQTFTVARSVNGIVKAQTTGASVRLAEPTFIA